MKYAKAVKRIMRDINDLNRTPMHDSGIYHSFDENNIFKLKVLVIGQSETPYYGGFYLFDFTFPETYPFQPPKVKYCTQSPCGKIRFNPNLYTDGKVCLSILNTWAGPGWAPTNSIRSVLAVLQAMVLNEYPMKNEPGFGNSDVSVWKKYNDVILHENYRVAVCDMLQKPRPMFKCFHDIINTYFVKNFKTYRDEILKLNDIYGNKLLTSPAYNMSMHAHYDISFEMIESLFEKLKDKYSQSKDILDDEKKNNDEIKNDIKKDTLDNDKKIDIHKVNYDNIMKDNSDNENKIDYDKLTDEQNLQNVLKAKIANISMTSLLCEIQDIAKKLDIDILKKSKKTNKMLRKTKHELLLSISKSANKKGLSNTKAI